MARTQAPASPPAAPTATPAAPPPAPAAAPVMLWPQPQVPASPTPEPKERRRSQGRGMPVGPALTAAGNAITLAATGAYEAGGWPALAATGAVAAGSTVAVAVRRRAAVKRRLATTAGSRGAAPRSATSGSRGGAGHQPSGNGRGVTANWGTPSVGASRRGATPRGGLLSAGSGRRNASVAPNRAAPKTGVGGNAGSRSTLAAAANRAARSNAKPGTLPRRAAVAASAAAAPSRQGTMARRAAAAAGRGARTAWIATRPHRATAYAATGRGLRHLRGAAWDGTKAAGAAIGTWIWHRSGRAALARFREAWHRHRATRAEKTAADAVTAAAATATAPAAVAGSVRRPNTTAIPATFTAAGAPLSGHHFTASAMEMCRAAANYQPTGMMQVGADFAGLKEALELHAEAMKITVENADAKHPLDPRIIETMRQIHSLQLKAAELAAELQPAFRRFHDVDIQRLENPRKGRDGERMWDVSANL